MIALVALLVGSMGVGADPAAAEVPVGLRSTMQSGITFVLTWDVVPGADSYVVYLDGEERGVSDDNWHVQRAVAPLTSYAVQVAAVVNGEKQELSDPVSVTTTDITLPPPPIVIEVLTPTYVTVKGAERPYADLQFERDGVYLGTNTQQWIDDDVAGGETYRYRLRYFSEASGAFGPWSEPVAVTTPGQPAGTILSAPLVTNTFADNSRVVLKIAGDDSARATGTFSYEIERNNEVVDSTRTGYVDRDRWYVDTGLPPGTEQTYRVRAVNWDGTRGVWSAPLMVSTTGTAPIDVDEPDGTGVVIEDLALHVVADGTVTLSWARLEGATRYQVTRNGETIRLLLSGANMYTDFRASSGDSYAVYAVADDGTPLSDPVAVRVPALTPRTGAITAMRVERRVVVLRWDGPTGVETYDVYRDDTRVAEVELGWAVDSAFSEVSFPDVDPLEPETTYRYRVETSSGEVIGSIDVSTVPPR